jgi:hypothetical protein
MLTSITLRLDFFTVLNIQIVVFWKRQGSSETLMSYHITTRYHNTEEYDMKRHHVYQFKLCCTCR